MPFPPRRRPRPRQILARANRLFDQGKFAEAAPIFERLAESAAQAGDVEPYWGPLPAIGYLPWFRYEVRWNRLGHMTGSTLRPWPLPCPRQEGG